MLRLSDENFEQEVLKHDGLVVVDFGATWCGPCKKLDPIMEELAGEYEGKAKVCSVDVGVAPKTAQEYRVLSVPQVLFFKEGQVIKGIVGFKGGKTKTEIIDTIEANS